jgi:hypothetical protein
MYVKNRPSTTVITASDNVCSVTRVVCCLLAIGLSGCQKQTDCWITGMTPVQGVQTTLNQVPLVAYKPTFVRVYVQSNESKHGPWTDITARLTVKDVTTGTTDTLLPVNTFNANSTITVSPTGSHQDKWGDSFTFWLKYGDTTPGAKELNATISSVSGGFESDTGDDHVWTLGPTFNPRLAVDVYGMVWAASDNSDGSHVGPAAPWSDFYGHQEYVQNVFPITNFSIVPLPGIGRAAPNPQPFTNLTGARTWADQELANLPANSKLNILNNWSDLDGYAAGSRSEEENWRTEGIGTTMAQEVSHTFGMWCHTFDKCDNYPHPDTSEIGSVDIGFDLAEDTTTSAVLLVSVSGLRDPFDNVIDGNRVTDFMSYNAPPNWVSSFSACQLVGVLWPVPVACNSVASLPTADRHVMLAGHFGFAQPAEAAPTDLPAPGNPDATGSAATDGGEHVFLYVAGTLKEDRASFDPFQMITARDDRATRLEGDKYRLTLEDNAGRVLAPFLFTPRVSDDKRSERTGPIHFSLVVPFDEYKDVTAAVVLRRGDKILATRRASLHYPKLTLSTAPTKQQSVAGHRTISWIASDPDKNPLTFGADYSPDGGRTWLPLNVGLNKQSLDVDFDDLPGSDRAQLRVWASNGLKTTLARLPWTFRVSRKSPQPAISQPADGATYARGQPFMARGSAYSLEDGVILDGTAYSWSSDRDGTLGSGEWIVLRKLSPGPHALTLTVHDSVGKTGTATVHVIVADKRLEHSAAAHAP